METQTPDIVSGNDGDAQAYDRWIERERRIRSRILRTSPHIRETGLYRICDDCSEVCLCHEERCPNCNSPRILQALILEPDTGLGQRIRCMFRFERLGRT